MFGKFFESLRIRFQATRLQLRFTLLALLQQQREMAPEPDYLFIRSPIEREE